MKATVAVLCGVVVLLIVGIAAVALRRARPVEAPPATLADVPGMKTTSLMRGPNGPVVHFKATSSNVCWMADYDMIQLELGASENAKLYVSVESLTPNDVTSFQPIVSQISLDALLQGSEVALSLPGVGEQAHLGFFFCKDSNNEGHCNGKDVVSYDQLHETYFENPLRPKRATPGYRASDKIYYFAYIYIHGDALEVLDSQMAAPGYDRLRSYLLSNGGDANAAESVVNRVHFLNDVLKSASVELHDTHITLDLPHHDTEKCKEFTEQIREQQRKRGIIPPKPPATPAPAEELE